MSSATTKTTSPKAAHKNKQQKHNKHQQQEQITTENDDTTSVPAAAAAATETAAAATTKVKNQSVEDKNVKNDNTISAGTSRSTGSSNNNKTPMENIQLITDIEDYKKALKAAGERLVVVEFFADWCKPCRVINPKLDELAAAYGKRIIILKIDIDQVEDLAQDFNINSIPTIVFMKNEKKLTQLSGSQKAHLEETLSILLKEPPLDAAKATLAETESEAVVVEMAAAASTTNMDETKEKPLNLPIVEPIKIPSVTKMQSNVTTKSSTTGTTTTTTTSKTKEALPTTTTNSRVDSEPTVNAEILNSEKSKAKSKSK